MWRGTQSGQVDDSDDEVYAAAKRADLDGAEPACRLDDVNAGVDHHSLTHPTDADSAAHDSKKLIEALAPVDHTRVQYEAFRKCFYTPHADIVGLSAGDVDELRRELVVRVDGTDAPRPIQSFVQLGFDRKMLAQLMKLGLEAPTAIQAQAFPVALSGRDMIGIAKTGSGKTLAFTLPMVRHVMDQRALSKDDGPIAVVLSPTRELAYQIFVHVKRFAGLYGAECAAIYGGVGKWEQVQAVRKGAEVIVATPGRLIDLIRKKTVRMHRVTFVVLDEADRMFEMGFEPQLRSVMGQVRPDRQTLMFSATFRRRIEALALDILTNPIKVTVGRIGQANEDIRQVAVVLANETAKWPWLVTNLKAIAAEGRVLIFAGSKLGCETLTKNLNAMSFLSRCLHGDKSQHERSEALAKFKSGECPILVATDVAARGLDVKDVKSVVNFDVAKTIDLHVHRIGRTGRMGHDGFEPGTAYTLVTSKESNFASQLVYNMDVSGQVVAADLLSLAKRDPRFRRGTPAARSSSSRAFETPVTQLEPGAHATSERTEDNDDAQEMTRWSESQRTSRADQRKGLGFAGAPVRGGRGGFHTGGFESMKPSATALASSFQSAFVKATAVSVAPPASMPAVASREAPKMAAPPLPVVVSMTAPSAIPPVLGPSLSGAPAPAPSASPPPSLAQTSESLAASSSSLHAPPVVSSTGGSASETAAYPAGASGPARALRTDLLLTHARTESRSRPAGRPKRPRLDERQLRSSDRAGRSARRRSRSDSRSSSSSSSESPRRRSSSSRRNDRSPSRSRSSYRRRSRSRERHRRRRSSGDRSRSRSRKRGERYSRSRSRSYERRGRRYR